MRNTVASNNKLLNKSTVYCVDIYSPKSIYRKNILNYYLYKLTFFLPISYYFMSNYI